MQNGSSEISRRELITRALVAGAGASLALAVEGAPAAVGAQAAAPARERKVKLGVVGCGGRGAWIANLFKEHGGYEMHAVADYFPDVAERAGDALGVDKSRRFSGLSGYKRLLESGIEAVALETPPFFFPEHASAAADAGVHVYMAKPVAVDVPGCKRIEAAAEKATAGKRCFLVDYQVPTDSKNLEVVRQIRAGAIGKPVALASYYLAAPFSDPVLQPAIEDRLQHLIWVNDVGIGGGYHVNACIHAVDSAMWLAEAVPSAAMGVSKAGRVNPHGDSHDVFDLTFEFDNGLILQHRGKHLADGYGAGDFCGCVVHGQSGYAQISYAGKALLLGGDNAYREDVVNLYEAGARRNIDTFYNNVIEQRFDNPTVRRAVDSCLATILGREAARRKTRVTMAQLMRENRKIEVNLKGLKA